jgi:hypothetical protein
MSLYLKQQIVTTRNRGGGSMHHQTLIQQMQGSLVGGSTVQLHLADASNSMLTVIHWVTGALNDDASLSR